MPKISNMPDMDDDLDIPDSKPKKPGMNQSPMSGQAQGLGSIMNLINGIMNGKISESDIGDMLGAAPEDSIGEDQIDDGSQQQITANDVIAAVQKVISEAGGDISSMSLQELVSLTKKAMAEVGIHIEEYEGLDEELANALASYLGSSGIDYDDGGDEEMIEDLTDLLNANGRPQTKPMAITDVGFCLDKTADLIASKLGGDSEDIYDQVTDAVMNRESSPDLPCGEKWGDFVNDIVSVYDALKAASSSILGGKFSQAQATQPSQTDDDQSYDGIDDIESVKEVMKMANGGDDLPADLEKDILSNYSRDELNAIASDYESEEDWSDGGIAYGKLASYIQNWQAQASPSAPNAQGAQATQQANPSAPAAPAAPALLPYSDIKRATHIASYLCVSDQDLETDMLAALGNPAKTEGKQYSSYPSDCLQNLDCANQGEVDWKAMLAGYTGFYISSSSDKMIICRTISDDVNLVGFDFSVFKDAAGSLKVFVPLMNNTIRQDGKPIRITDYVPQKVISSMADKLIDSEDDNSTFAAIASPAQTPSQADAEKSIIAEYHKSALEGYDERKTEAYCNLAIKEKTFVSMCLKEFGSLEKKIDNKQYMRGFVYVGEVTPDLSNLDVKYFISDHELDPNKKSYEFYVKVSTTEMSPDELAAMKPILAGIDYSSDTISNINIESDGEIIFLNIPVMYYLKK